MDHDHHHSHLHVFIQAVGDDDIEVHDFGALPQLRELCGIMAALLGGLILTREKSIDCPEPKWTLSPTAPAWTAKDCFVAAGHSKLVADFMRDQLAHVAGNNGPWPACTVNPVGKGSAANMLALVSGAWKHPLRTSSLHIGGAGYRNLQERVMEALAAMASQDLRLPDVLHERLTMLLDRLVEGDLLYLAPVLALA